MTAEQQLFSEMMIGYVVPDMLPLIRKSCFVTNAN